ncbi:MAG: hypothetical protein ACYS7M_02960, partial [Planctomycetota bacterium]
LLEFTTQPLELGGRFLLIGLLRDGDRRRGECQPSTKPPAKKTTEKPHRDYLLLDRYIRNDRSMHYSSAQRRADQATRFP